MTVRKVGDFPDDLSSQRALMKAFLSAFKPGNDIKNAMEIYRTNGELLASLPEPGQKMLIQNFNALVDPQQSVQDEVDVLVERAKQS